MTYIDGAVTMNTPATQSTQTMTITAYGTNEIVSSPPQIRNKGRVNHTLGYNNTCGSSLSIVSERVTSSTENQRSSATGIAHPIMIKQEANAVNAVVKRVEEITSNSDIKPEHTLSMHQNTAYPQVSSPQPPPIYEHHQQQTKDTSAVTPQECGQKDTMDISMNMEMNMNTNLDTTTHTGKNRRTIMNMKSGVHENMTSEVNTQNNPIMKKCTPKRTRKTTNTEAPNTRRIPQGKAEVRYDMNLVPKVKRNPEFLQKWRQATVASASTPVFSPLPNLVPCDTVSYCDASTDSKSTSSENSPCPSSSDHQNQDHSSTQTSQSKPCHQACLAHSNEQKNDRNRNTAYIPTQITPFAEDCESCIWVPQSRSDWEACINELVNVCTAASWHKERHSLKKKSKEFSPPISEIYVKDRLDVDDPLRGYQIRHRSGGWLQGFVMMTDFTIWTHYFKWDSMHPMNGINRENVVGFVDDGTLTKDLEKQPRSGDPHGVGVIWPTIAEISLVGALGCGEYLVQMALDDIERRGTYEFVVLEATETSRPFYEKFGFVRVGAVCKYGKQEDFASVEETGYRHWTYANETKGRLNEHGGPSCMMARKINRRDNMGRSHCQSCGKLTEPPSFIDKLANYFVSKKPTITPLGTSSNRKRSRTASAGSLEKSTKMAKTAKDPTRTTASGRQTRTPTRLEETPENLTLQRPKNQSTARCSRNSTSASLPVLTKGPTPRSSNKTILRKQKIQNMYRDPRKTYFYNKVVCPKSNTDTYNYKSRYYFVLNFEEDVKMVRLIPLYRRGTFKGKREGREKWKAIILPRNDLDEKKWLKSMDVITAPASKWDIVRSYMVTKCSSVGEESWDINC